MTAEGAALPALLVLGAVHGLNPAMGWLFAVALGLQEQARAAVWRALLPLAAGHALAVAVAVALGLALGAVLRPQDLRWMVAAALFGVGVFHLARHRHPRWGGMRVGMRDLAIWSFLMASAHGAGLMALPFVLGGRGEAVHAAHAAGGHAAHAVADSAAGPLAGLAATAVHTAGYLAVTGVVAVLVYEKLGLRLLGRLWFNVDRLWAGALVATAVLTLVW
jgi:hypothetical protein